MHLALADIFRARWTEAIHDEWSRNLRRDRPELPDGQIARVRTLMDRHVLDAVVSGYEWHIPTIVLPDPDDRHVVAAAIHAGAGVIVTYNLGDFPAGPLGLHGIVAQHPDSFLVGLLDADESKGVEVVGRLRRGLRRPPVSAEGYLLGLERLSLPRSAAWLRRFVDRI